MNLKSKQLDFIVEKVSIIANVIKEGRQAELPHQIFHLYEKGEILIGINGIIMVIINGEYVRVDGNNYLLIPSGWGGKCKILKDLGEINYHFDCIDSTSLEGCLFKYCDSSPKCEDKCRYA